MKNIFKIVFVLFAVISLGSCKKDDNKVILKGGTAPVLTSSVSGDVPLSKATQDQAAMMLSWTNPNYQFNTGVSSQDVNYTLQFDTTADFSNPDMQEVTVAKDLSTTLTVRQLNSIMAKIGLQPNISHNINVRIIAAFPSGAVKLISNVIKFTATPYLDVAVPLPFTGNLFLIGSATAGGWNQPVPVPSQQFTQTSATTYEITIALTGDQEFLIIPQNGSWDNKYAITRGSTDPNSLRQAGSFGYNLGDNFYGPSASGTYQIVLNFVTGKYTVTKQ